MADLVPVRRGAQTPARAEDSGPQRRPDPFLTPFREFDELWDRMVARFFGGPASGATYWTQGWTPPVDIEETSDAWIFEVELPGASRDDLQVEVSDGELAISGEIREPERSGVLRHRARHTGTFRYATTLPAGIDADRVEARFENGVLTVRVPRPESSRPRQIKIN
jgi:HSP20 family protein